MSATEMTKRKFRRTVITIEVLSEEEGPESASLETLAHEVVYGDWSHRIKVDLSEEIDGKRAAELLAEHGSDPSFFGLDEEGNDV